MSHFDADPATPHDLPSHVFLLEEWAGHPSGRVLAADADLVGQLEIRARSTARPPSLSDAQVPPPEGGDTVMCYSLSSSIGLLGALHSDVNLPAGRSGGIAVFQFVSS